MLSVAIVKGDVSLISLLASLLYVYRRATDFFELILYPSTSLKVFINYRSSLVEFFWGHLCTALYHLQKLTLNLCQ